MKLRNLALLLLLPFFLMGCASNVQVLEGEQRVSQEQFRTAWLQVRNYRVSGFIVESGSRLDYSAQVEDDNIYLQAELKRTREKLEVIHVDGRTYRKDGKDAWQEADAKEVLAMWVGEDKTLLGSHEVLADLLLNPDVRGGVIRKDGKVYTVYQGSIDTGKLAGTWEMLVDQGTHLPSRIVWGAGGARQVEMNFKDFGATDFHILPPV